MAVVKICWLSAGLAFLFREGLDVQFNRFADIGDRLVQRLPMRVATFQLRAPCMKAMFVFFDSPRWLFVS